MTERYVSRLGKTELLLKIIVIIIIIIIIITFWKDQKPKELWIFQHLNKTYLTCL